MDTSTSRFDRIQNAGNIIGLSFAMVLHLNKVCTLNINWFVILLSVNLIYILFFLMNHNKRNIFTYITVSIMALFTFIFIILYKVNLYENCKNLLNWFQAYETTKNNYQISNALILILISIVFLIIVFHFINKNVILQFITSLALLVWLVYCAMDGLEVNKITLGIIVIYILQFIVMVSNTLYNGKKNTGGVLPLCILIGIIAVSIPSRPQPIQWKIVKQVIHSISDKWDEVTYKYGIIKGKYSEEFSLNFTGYSDEDRISLGGKIYQSDETILKVASNSTANGTTYLIGNVRDNYNNNGWKRSNIDYNSNQEQIIDFYQMLYGLYQGNVVPKEKEVLFHPMKLSINYKNIRTKSLFYPSKTFNMESEGTRLSVDTSNPTLISNKLLKKGFSYQIDYLEINYESETLQNYLRMISKSTNIDTKQNFKLDECVSYLKNLTNLSYFDDTILNKDFAKLLENRSNIINKYYTKVPEQVPNRVRELAKQITENYDNDYDKLRAIETYLSTFNYTLSPSETKEGEDFVDYFLFEQREGYCTYFATTMAILSRCIDIPTRYVEGVLVDYKNQEGGYYIVNSKSSHAWVEAYIEGFGWIPFEPTPVNYEDRYVRWEEKSDIDNPIPEMSAPEFSHQNNISKVNTDMLSKQKTQRIKYMLLLCMIIIIIIVLIMIGVFLGLYYSKNRKYKHASNEEKIKYLVHDILMYLTMDDQEIQVGETLLDYVKRLGVTYDFEEITLEQIALIYMKLRYANKQILEIELEKATLYHNQLKSYIVKNTGRLHRIKFYCRKVKYSC